MFAAFLALIVGVILTFGVFIYTTQYPTNDTFIVIWFTFVLALASYQISNFLTPFLTKILP